MKTYRIGNSITIKWTLKTEDGSPYILNAENTELYATVPNHKIKIEDFTVNDNVLTWIFGGDEQKFFGPYTLTLVQNRGKVGMVTVDSCDAFNLVPWSCLAGGSDTPNINTDSTRLESTVSLSQVGLSPEVQEAINEIITEYNVSNHYPTGGIDGTDRYTLETAIAKIPESLRKAGLKCTFLNDNGLPETWKYLGASYDSRANWIQSDMNAVYEIANQITALVSQNILALQFDPVSGELSAIVGADGSAFESGEILETGDIVLNFDYPEN